MSEQLNAQAPTLADLDGLNRHKAETIYADGKHEITGVVMRNKETGEMCIVESCAVRWLDKAERAEKQARATDRRLAAIMSASADAILGLDAAGRIEAWNHGAELLFGYAADRMQGQPFFHLFGRGEAAEVENEISGELCR